MDIRNQFLEVINSLGKFICKEGFLMIWGNQFLMRRNISNLIQSEIIPNSVQDLNRLYILFLKITNCIDWKYGLCKILRTGLWTNSNIIFDT